MRLRPWPPFFGSAGDNSGPWDYHYPWHFFQYINILNEIPSRAMHHNRQQKLLLGSARSPSANFFEARFLTATFL
jgi:hypothetical protein